MELIFSRQLMNQLEGWISVSDGPTEGTAGHQQLCSELIRFALRFDRIPRFMEIIGEANEFSVPPVCWDGEMPEFVSDGEASLSWSLTGRD